MTLQEIAARLDKIKALWPSDSDSPRLDKIERLQIDIEIAIRQQRQPVS